jgi:hypothetical protein
MTQGGGLLQLVAIGKQDVFLTGNPSVTWFKHVYRRYTNFAIESQQMYIQGTPNFGQKITCLVPRNGDLLSSVFLKVTLPKLVYTSASAAITKSAVAGYVNSPGHTLIQEISIQIGEQEIDKQTGQYMEIWSSLTVDASQQAGFQEMIGQKPGYPLIDTRNNAFDLSGYNYYDAGLGKTVTLPKWQFSREAGNLNIDISGMAVSGGLISPNPAGSYTPGGGNTVYPRQYDEPIIGPQVLYIPLRFWFNKNPGLALPLLAMQYHPVRINITLAPLQDMFYSKTLYDNENSTSTTPQCNAGLTVEAASPLGLELWGDYVYLDVPERRRFVSAPLEYLIEQVQYTPPLAIPANSRNATLKLDFNHPIKEFIWVFQRNVMQSRHEYFNWSSLGFYEIEKKAQWAYAAGGTQQQMDARVAATQPPNRTDLFVAAKFQLDGQDRFDARDPKYFRLVQPYQRHTTIPSDRYIYVYSFALRPEDDQPSGTLNASRIDNLVLQVDLQESGTIYNTSATFGDMSAYVYARNYNVLRVIDGYAGLLFSV